MPSHHKKSSSTPQPVSIPQLIEGLNQQRQNIDSMINFLGTQVRNTGATAGSTLSPAQREARRRGAFAAAKARAANLAAAAAQQKKGKTQAVGGAR